MRGMSQAGRTANYNCPRDLLLFVLIRKHYKLFCSPAEFLKFEEFVLSERDFAALDNSVQSTPQFSFRPIR